VNLSVIDWLIMLVYFIFVLGIGFALKRYMRTSNDFFSPAAPSMDSEDMFVKSLKQMHAGLAVLCQ
jgi:hypothetical protein